MYRRAILPRLSLALVAISDIVTEVQLPETIGCNATLCAACIGGAARQDTYRGQIAGAGMIVVKARDNRRTSSSRPTRVALARNSA